MLLNGFGEKVKQIREIQGLSQVRLSELTGIVREQISRIENGQVNPTLETMYKLSVAYDVPLKELLDFEIESKVIKKDYKMRPFVKWAGGKTQILEQLKELMPKDYNTYFEPFVGGGALLFNLKPYKAVIQDSNYELICAYKCFQDEKSYNLLIEEILKHENNHTEAYYLEVREMDRNPKYSTLPIHVIAARMIYLNKACFNGLYRVNSKGYFNVPSGKKQKVKAYDKENFDALYNYFSNNMITVLNGDFSDVLNHAKKGDFVYFDPPYDTYDNNGFTSYTKNSFDRNEQKRLADVFRELDSRGVYVMLSNHNTDFINDIYLGYKINVIQAKRMINSKGTGRGSVEEVIITNY
ncbi:MAG: Dam family site-specific DNA-(adenine-N6)-methyltransferase [Bacilli bacterium]